MFNRFLFNQYIKIRLNNDAKIIIIIIIIIIPLFITFGDKNYGNITVKKKEIQNTTCICIHFYGLYPLDLDIKLNFYILKGTYWLKMASILYILPIIALWVDEVLQYMQLKTCIPVVFLV